MNEPRGFIRALQWLLAIIAFATCSSYTSEFTFSFDCTTSSGTKVEKQVQTVNISYPFAIAKSNPNFYIFENTEDCETNKNVHIPGDVSPSASWFVFVGVISFIYCMAVIFYYIFIEPSMRLNDEVPALNNVDLVLSAVVVFLWLTAASSLAWAKGQLKLITSHENFVKESDLHDFCGDDTPGVTCSSTSPGFVELNASIAFGFLNFFVWLGSVWFVWKEASFFKRADPPSQPSTINA